MTRNISVSYYGWITQSVSGTALRAAVQSFVDILSSALAELLGERLDFLLLPEMDVSDQIAAIRRPPATRGDASIALMNPFGYAWTHQQLAAVEAVAVVRRRIGESPPGPTYKAQIYANIASRISALSDLRKRSFAFGSPQSTSNFLVPAHLLWRHGLHPMVCFSRVEFAGGHDTAARAVYEGHVDAAAGHDGVILDLANRPGFGDAADRLVRIAWSDPVPSDPIVLHSTSSDFKTALGRALEGIAPANNPETPANIAVKGFWGTGEGIEAIASDAYATLLANAGDLRLRPEDLLRRW